MYTKDHITRKGDKFATTDGLYETHHNKGFSYWRRNGASGKPVYVNTGYDYLFVTDGAEEDAAKRLNKCIAD
jgi:hypothetical protein